MYNEHRCHSGKLNHSDCRPRGGRFGRHFKHHHPFFEEHFRKVPVNIEETDQHFIIHVYAPDLAKEHLKVITKDDVLTISYTVEERAEDAKKFSRREYSNGNFERAFALNGKVLVDQISAGYADGILKVSLPKNPETNTPAKNIAVD
jgi:HSP20 family protein